MKEHKEAAPDDETRTSAEWMKHPEFTGITILDPDGWNRANYDHSFNHEQITRTEFLKRLLGSTINRHSLTYQRSGVDGNP